MAPCFPFSRLSVVVATLAVLAGCGGTSVYQPSRFAPLETDPAAEINDDDVRKAFEAKPQMGSELRIAYFTYASDKSGPIEETLRTLPGVVGTYSIPSLMVTGQRPFDEFRPWEQPAPQPLSMKKLRLLAARAHCDALVVVDYGWRVNGSVNGLVAFNILLVPALFLPFRDLTYESYVDAFVLDTRNGYLYGRVNSHEEQTKAFATIYAQDDPVIGDQWTKLRTELDASLHRLLQTERAAH